MHTARPQRAATSKPRARRRGGRHGPRRAGRSRLGRLLDRLLRRRGHAASLRDLRCVDRGEHAPDDRHAERAADLPGQLVHRGTVAGLLEAEVVHDHRRGRRADEADAAADDRRADQHERGRAVTGEQQQRHEAAGRGEQAREEDGARPVAGHEPPAHRSGHAEHQAERRDHGARRQAQIRPGRTAPVGAAGTTSRASRRSS